jgi:hypothetical protein
VVQLGVEKCQHAMPRVLGLALSIRIACWKDETRPHARVLNDLIDRAEFAEAALDGCDLVRGTVGSSPTKKSSRGTE